ncbi:hypothetical protein [Nocardia wallacei]|uniref:hypothetical protein n=1 Tax=Nocardia wallacei TaxID=480035 RepID=UPI00245626BD|nr:hypothetical protein [Nocardia wallacei]
MTAVRTHQAPGAWDEPEGVAPRGTVVLLPRRGETAASYARLGRRLAADGYRVRYVPGRLEDVAAARAAVEDLLADESLPAPRVLLGSDSGAPLAARSCPWKVLCWRRSHSRNPCCDRPARRTPIGRTSSTPAPRARCTGP